MQVVLTSCELTLLHIITTGTLFSSQVITSTTVMERGKGLCVRVSEYTHHCTLMLAPLQTPFRGPRGGKAIYIFFDIAKRDANELLCSILLFHLRCIEIKSPDLPWPNGRISRTKEVYSVGLRPTTWIWSRKNKLLKNSQLRFTWYQCKTLLTG